MIPAPMFRRVWVRKPNGTPTTLQISSDDLVDDLKTYVMQKYPTSLAREFDPADLMVKLEVLPINSSSSPSHANQILKRQSKFHQYSNLMYERQTNSPISPVPISSTKSPLLQQPNSFSTVRGDEDSLKSQSPFTGYTMLLRPDQNVWKVLDQFFPNGMTMNEAFVIDVPTTSNQLRQQTSGSQQQGFSSAFNSYTSPQKSDSTTDLQSMGPPQLNHQSGRYSHSQSFSGEFRQLPTRRSMTSHRRSSSNPQSPQNSSFLKPNGNPNNTTILMLPKDYNGGNKERPHNQIVPETKPNEINNIPELKKGTIPSPPKAAVRALAPESASSTSKIKSTTEKVFPSINVLIVEDNKINQKILQAFLRKRKINFQTALNGEEAIEKWKHGGFHLVLMDIQLPVKSGIDATIEIRRLEKLNKIGLFSSSSSNINKLPLQEELDLTIFRSPVIIVALTASTSSLDRQKALAAGCNDFLTKPVNLDWLQNKITEWGCMQALIDFDHWKD